VNSGRPRYDHELLGSSFAHNAELAAVTPQGPLNIVTPCHGMPLRIRTHYDGEVEEIWCPAEGCHNYWNEDGTVGYWREAE
jgi:hypothetical protein